MNKYLNTPSKRADEFLRLSKLSEILTPDAFAKERAESVAKLRIPKKYADAPYLCHYCLKPAVTGYRGTWVEDWRGKVVEADGEVTESWCPEDSSHPLMYSNGKGGFELPE